MNAHRAREAANDFDEEVQAALAARGIRFVAKANALNAEEGSDCRRYLLDDNGTRLARNFVGVLTLANTIETTLGN